MYRSVLVTALVSIPLLVGCDVSGMAGEGRTPYSPATSSPSPETSGLTDWSKYNVDDDSPSPKSTDPAADGERIMREFEERYEQEQATEVPEGYCRDVTSYDNNWDNDMLCTDEYGRQFYTDYAGAGRYE